MSVNLDFITTRPMPLSAYDKKKTNADRIRAMTDEELAHILATHDCYDCILDEYHVCESVDGRCGSERVLNWLKQEAET